ncbi:MAG: TorA maturation chaperone TorD [Halobacteriales archaeon]|jgi:TorA maturation chaperone TorD
MAAAATLERPDAWADLLAAVGNCLRDPDEALVESVRSGELRDALAEATATVDFDPETGVDPPAVASLGDLTESSLELFEAMRTPYAPPAESPYKPWYDDRTGLMGGPPAEDMVRRYEAIDADVPEGYPPDHVVLLLEYGTVLLDAGEIDAVAGHVVEHLDWIPAFALATEGAAADAPFHRWAIHLLDDTTDVLRSRLELDTVGDDVARTMVGRVSDATTPTDGN